MKNKPSKHMVEIMIKNTRINRVTYLIGGILFAILGIWAFPLLVIGVLLLYLSYLTNKKYTELIKEQPIESEK